MLQRDGLGAAAWLRQLSDAHMQSFTPNRRGTTPGLPPRSYRSVSSLALAGGLVLGAALAACDEPPVEPLVPPDSLPPVIAVLSPTDSAYDADGDGLVDVSLLLRDAAGPVVLDSLRLRSVEGVTGPAGDVLQPDNLLDVWAVVARRDTLLRVHETVHYLLPQGLNHLEVGVPDTAGNWAVDTFPVELPWGAFHQTIPSGLTLGIEPALGLTYCADDQRLYMTAGRRLVLYDPDSLRLDAVIEPGGTDVIVELSRALCVPGDPVLYVTDDARLQRFESEHPALVARGRYLLCREWDRSVARGPDDPVCRRADVRHCRRH